MKGKKKSGKDSRLCEVSQIKPEQTREKQTCQNVHSIKKINISGRKTDPELYQAMQDEKQGEKKYVRMQQPVL